MDAVSFKGLVIVCSCSFALLAGTSAEANCSTLMTDLRAWLGGHPSNVVDVTVVSGQKDGISIYGKRYAGGLWTSTGITSQYTIGPQKFAYSNQIVPGSNPEQRFRATTAVSFDVWVNDNQFWLGYAGTYLLSTNVVCQNGVMYGFADVTPWYEYAFGSSNSNLPALVILSFEKTGLPI